MTTTLATRLDQAIRAANVAIAGVSIGNPADKSTWTVQPASLQAAAQATINAFNPNDPSLDTADLDAEVTAALDTERLISAVVWEVIGAVNPPATKNKYNAARSNIIANFKAQPWK